MVLMGLLGLMARIVSYVDRGFGVAPPLTAICEFWRLRGGALQKLAGQLFGTFGSEGPETTTFGLRGRVHVWSVWSQGWGLPLTRCALQTALGW